MTLPRRVLFVEDSEDMRAVIQLALTKLGGFEANGVPDGAAALLGGL